MSNDLQKVVDALGEQLNRAVAIDDPRMRLIVYSPHYGAVDAARLDSILRRQAPAGATAYVRSLGIDTAEGPVRVKGHPELELLARVCVPVRHQGLLLGYLWLIDEDESLAEGDLDAADRAANAAAIPMYREQFLHDRERGREQALLRDLLGEDPNVRAAAARQVVESNLLDAASGLTIMVLQPLHPRQRGLDDGTRNALDAALVQTARSAWTSSAVHIPRTDHGVLLIGGGEDAARLIGVADLGSRLRGTLVQGLPDPAWRVVVGIGESVADPAGAMQSYHQARVAARVAAAVPEHAPVASWARLGVYRTIAQLPADELTEEKLHAGLAKLFAAENADVLVKTLECYLTHGGEVKASAEALAVHRTSLYYRLSRIEEIAGVNMRDGEDRLALHLGLKVARLAGIHPGSD